MVRADGSILVTALLQKELWCVPGPQPQADVQPILLQTFDQLVSGIVEVEPDVFIINLCSPSEQVTEAVELFTFL